MKQITVEAIVDNLPEVNDFIQEQLDEFKCSKKFQMQILLVVEEIFVNIASYAYDSSIGSVNILLDVEDNVLSLIFIDSGLPFNPLIKEDPDISLSADERPVGGLGIFLVKNIVNDISYERVDDKNVLKISKNLT